MDSPDFVNTRNYMSTLHMPGNQHITERYADDVMVSTTKQSEDLKLYMQRESQQPKQRLLQLNNQQERPTAQQSANKDLLGEKIYRPGKSKTKYGRSHNYKSTILRSTQLHLQSANRAFLLAGVKEPTN